MAKTIAGMAVTLGGIDDIVFTGGIGEHDAVVRATVCRLLGWAGIRLDDVSNDAAAKRVDDPTSTCRLRVLQSR